MSVRTLPVICGEYRVKEGRMSTQRIDLSNLNVEIVFTSCAREPLAPEETVVEENEQAAPDEFEIRRKAFFAA